MKYYAVVDKDGARGICVDTPPTRDKSNERWEGCFLIDIPFAVENFPSITWQNLPVEIRIKVEVVK